MNEWTIDRYDGSRADEWNDFVAKARNATFLFNRSYMDYHADRFEDCSMLAWKGEKLMAVLPANITPDGVLHSHQGLTYGGWILRRQHDDCVTVLEFWNEWLRKCREMGIKAIDYKPLPHIYAIQPSEEDIYALFRSRAVISECHASGTIRLANNPGLNENRKRLLKKAGNTQFHTCRCGSEEDFRTFHKILFECLSERHNAVPVHSLDEIVMLHNRFLDNIQLWGIYADGAMQAGVLLYISERVVHAQYIATTAEAREQNLLTPLFIELISQSSQGTFGTSVEYFDFGTSNEDHGLVLNGTLYRQKASFGATCIAYPRYLLKL